MRLSAPLRRSIRPLGRWLRRALIVGESRRARRRAQVLAANSETALREVAAMGEGIAPEVLVFGMTHRLSGGAGWHTDRWSGRRWPLAYHRSIETNRVIGGSDVKWPWELSRFQFLGTWAIAWVEDRNSDAAHTAVRIMADWMRSNPLGMGINWTCAMEGGIRAINWLFARALLRDSPVWTDTWDATVVDWLLEHAVYIRENLEEWGPNSQNHLVADLVGALCIWSEVGGLKHRRDAEWARDRLVECMSAQVYADGVSFENSTTYHVLAAELFATALACGVRNSIEFPPAYIARLRLMFAHTASIADSSGRVPVVGDCDDGRVLVVRQVAESGPREMSWFFALGSELFPDMRVGAFSASDALDAAYAARWSKPAEDCGSSPSKTEETALAPFPEGGLFMLSGGPTRALAVFARTGVSGTGPHRHNDALSIVVDVGDRQFLIDSGTYCYQHDPDARRAFRAAGSHCTAMVDGMEHNALDSLFALSRDRIRSEILGWGSDEGTVWVSGSMRTFVDVGVIWSRTVRLNCVTGELSTADEFAGSGWPHRIEVFWRYAPGVELEAARTEGSSLEWYADSLPFKCEVNGGGAVHSSLLQAPGWYSERYRTRVKAPGLMVSAIAESSVTLVTTMTPLLRTRDRM